MRRVTPAVEDADASSTGHAARAAARVRAGQRPKDLTAGVLGRLAGSLALAGALAAPAGLGGCAGAPPTEAAVRGQPTAARAQVVPCSTTWLVLATVSKCGSGGLKFGVATE